MKQIDINEVVFEVFAEAELIPVTGNVLDSGDPKVDRMAEVNICRRLARGETWAWCSVEVRATYRNTLVAKNFLGCCSYKNEKDFIKNSGYYEDMKLELVNELQLALEALLK